MKQTMILGFFDCLFMAAFVAASVLSILTLGL